MRNPRLLPVLLLLAPFLVSGQTKDTGPFGFTAGMTKEQVIHLVGKVAVREGDDVALLLTTAPKPYADFDSYFLIFSPERGLVKVLAATRNLNTSSFGTEICTEFDKIQKPLTMLYGTPTTDSDHLKNGSVWTQPQDWMMGLLQKERSKENYWAHRWLPHYITAIGLVAHASSLHVGFITLAYEFEGFEEFSEKREAQKNSVF